MKLALLSDTHGFTPDLPPGMDAIIHAGDIAVDRGVDRNYADEIYPWAEEAGVPIYATFGNHDLMWPPTGAPDNLRFAVDESVTIGGIKFWFSPWSNLFGNWNWMRTEEGLAERYALIPDDTEVIVSHGPPKGYGDRIYWDNRYQRVGSQSLLDRIDALPNLKLVVCGHIHEAFGEYQAGNVRVLNVSHVDDQYRPTNPPVEIEL